MIKRISDTRELPSLLSCWAVAEGSWQLAAQIAKRNFGWSTKAAIGSVNLVDLAGSFRNAVSGEYFLEVKTGPAGFDRLFPYMIPAAIKRPLFLGNSVQGTFRQEGWSFPASHWAAQSAQLDADKVANLVVVGKETLRILENAQAVINEQRAGVSKGTDERFFPLIQNDAGFVEAATADVLGGLKRLQGAVNLSGFGPLFFACGPETANCLSTMRSGPNDNLLFPDCSCTGGALLGLELIVSPGIQDDFYLVEPSGIAANQGTMEIKLSENALIEMDDAPGMNSPAPAGPTSAFVSVFQVDALAIMTIRTFAAKLVRPSSVGVLSGLSAWGVEFGGESL